MDKINTRVIKKLDNGSTVIEKTERIHTRKIDRNVIKYNMRAQGVKQICKQGRKNGKRGESHFASAWKKFGGYNGGEERSKQAQ